MSDQAMTATRLSRVSVVLIPTLCALIGLLGLILDPPPLQTLRHGQFDQFQRWQPRPYVDVPVRIVDVDRESLARIGQWPWPRTRIAELVERLRGADAAAIGFDVLFAEADRTSPAAMAQLWQLTDRAKAALAQLPDHDRVLADTIRPGGVALGFAATRQAADQPATIDAGSPPYRYLQSGSPPTHWLHAFAGAEWPLPELDRAAAGRGAISFVPDTDGVVRRVPLVLELAGQPAPSLVAELLRIGQGGRNYILNSSAEDDTGLESIRIGELVVPTTPRGEVWVHYSEPVPGRYIPAWKVLLGQVEPSQLAGSLVLVGSSAQGLQDLRFSPLGHIMPGVEAHAQALEQILAGQDLNRPAWATAVEAIVLVFGCLFVGILAMTARALLGAGATLVIVASCVAASWLAYTRYGLLLNALLPAWAIGLTFMVASLVHHLYSERQQRWIKAAFSRYVSPNLVQYLVSHPGQLELGGERRQCSFIFTDLAGFTSLMEKTDPADAVALLNSYLDQMIAIAFRHQGTLDRIVGDAVAIMFSAPLQQGDHRQRALRCALEMDAFANAYMASLNAQGKPFGLTRIGVHAGEVIVGNFGGSTIFDYRALGDPVNTAARLESSNKHLGTRLCVSEIVMSASPDVAARPVGRLLLKGKTEALNVLEPLTADGLPERAPLADYLHAYQAMRDGVAAASGLFDELHRRFPTDPLVALHARRLAAGESGDLIVMAEK